MSRKEFIEHYNDIYNDILNFPEIGRHQERIYLLKDKIQQLADIDKISYSLALKKIYSVFFSQYLETDLDDSRFKNIEKATWNLLFLRYLEGSDAIHQ